jgi:hypothetical protein
MMHCLSSALRKLWQGRFKRGHCIEDRIDIFRPQRHTYLVMDKTKTVLHRHLAIENLRLKGLSKDASFLHTTILTMCTAKNKIKFRS